MLKSLFFEISPLFSQCLEMPHFGNVQNATKTLNRWINRLSLDALDPWESIDITPGTRRSLFMKLRLKILSFTYGHIVVVSTSETEKDENQLLFSNHNIRQSSLKFNFEALKSLIGFSRHWKVHNLWFISLSNKKTSILWFIQSKI